MCTQQIKCVAIYDIVIRKVRKHCGKRRIYWSPAKDSLNNIFQDSFNKILSQQLTHDRSYISQQTTNVRFF